MDNNLSYSSPSLFFYHHCIDTIKKVALLLGLIYFSTTRAKLRRVEGEQKCKPEPWIKRKKKKTQGREYPNDIIITESSKLGVEDGACAPGCSGQTQCEDPAVCPRLPGRLPAICLLPRLFAFMHFNDATIFLTQFVYLTPVQENVIGSVIYSRTVKPQMPIHSTRNFNSHNQATEGLFTTFNSTLPSLNFCFMGSFFMLPTISPL